MTEDKGEMARAQERNDKGERLGGGMREREIEGHDREERGGIKRNRSILKEAHVK